MIPSRRRKVPKRLPILGALAALVLCALGIAVLAQNATSGSLLTVLTPEPTPGSVPNPYCRSQPSGDLPPLDVSDMRLWNYEAAWHASQWDNAFSRIPWRSDHVSLAANGDVVLRLDGSGAPQIKSGSRIAMADKGTWETEVTLPEMREGMVVAPLWLFNQDRREEIDFEFAGTKSLDLSLHAYPRGEHRKTSPTYLQAGRRSMSRTSWFIASKGKTSDISSLARRVRSSRCGRGATTMKGSSSGSASGGICRRERP